MSTTGHPFLPEADPLKGGITSYCDLPGRLLMFRLSLLSLYWMLSTRACQLASMMFSETPIVLHSSSPSRESRRTLTRAAHRSLGLFAINP